MLATDTAARELAVDLYYSHMDHLTVYPTLHITNVGPAYQVQDDRRTIFKGQPYRVLTPEVTYPGAYMCDCGAHTCEHIGAVLLERIAYRTDFSTADFITYRGK
ncbi:MAG: hypothetical protein ACXWQZ_00495 [Ktedonobacterales bacterium]